MAHLQWLMGVSLVKSKPYLKNLKLYGFRVGLLFGGLVGLQTSINTHFSYLIASFWVLQYHSFLINGQISPCKEKENILELNSRIFRQNSLFSLDFAEPRACLSLSLTAGIR